MTIEVLIKIHSLLSLTPDTLLWNTILIILKVNTNLFWIVNLILLVFFASVGVYSYCCGSHRYYETKV